MKKTQRQKTSRGFTLIELLVVIAIISVLAGIVLIALNSAREKGRDAKRIGDMKQLSSAMEQYYIQHGVYPTGNASTQPGGAALDDAGAFDLSSEPMVPNYIPTIPAAPTPADGSCDQTPGLGHNNYWYEVAADGSFYTLTACIGQDSSDWHAGTRSLTPDGLQ